MRAIRYESYGGTEVFRIDDMETPDPGPNELLVEVRAAGVNPLDVVYRKGIVKPADTPAMPGSDVAGVVAATGDEVTMFAEGDRVFGTGQAANPLAGYGEYAVVPAAEFARLPEDVSFQTGAGLGVPGVTAWRAIVDHGEVTPADTVLVHGGTGGVGHLAVQIATTAGAKVVTTGGTEIGRTRLEDLGAAAVLDYDHDSLAAAIRDIGEPDVVLDHRLDDYLELDVDVAAHGGRIVTIFGDVPGLSNTATARSKELSLQAMALSNTPNVSSVLERLGQLVLRRQLKVHVDRTFELSAAADAHEHLDAGDFFGKLIVEP